MAKTARMVSSAMATALLLLACSDGDEDYVRPVGRGSAACQAWQNSLCDLVVECSDMSEQECVDNYFGVTCLADDAAQSCSVALDNATCSSLPANCDLSDMADATPAIAACNTYVATVCQRQSECGVSTVDVCTADAASQFDCSLAIAYVVTFETCISKVTTLACTAESLPAECEDVIKIYQG